MIFPTIHLNGTSKKTLLEDWEEALNALRIALEKLAAAAPNGRDYYTQGPDAISQASDEHRARMEKIRSVMADIETLREAVSFK